MQRPIRLPLFPLEVVLLPGMSLPLHIFEPRYKTMIGRCLKEKSEFGMVLASRTSVASVGCTAEIIKKVREYPDGRMDIATEGRAVFLLTELLDEKEYYEAMVRYPEDEPLKPDPKAEEELVTAVDTCHTMLFGSRWGAAGRNEPANLSYEIGAVLPLELEKRQSLLEMRSENARREFLQRWLTDFLPKLAEQQRMRERAGGNGHAHN
jgi:Lon protease-like protein